MRKPRKPRWRDMPTERWWRHQALRALGASHLEALKASEDVEDYQIAKDQLLFADPHPCRCDTTAVSATARLRGHKGGSV